jgi:Biotin/lipoate A/B protein ligase family
MTRDGARAISMRVEAPGTQHPGLAGMSEDIRPAAGADIAAVQEIVRTACLPWVEIIGMRPLPLEADGHGNVLDARLKWPNDVLVGERKLGGILFFGPPASGGLAMTLVPAFSWRCQARQAQGAATPRHRGELWQRLPR